MFLPKCDFPQTASHVEGCCRESKSLEYTAHGGNSDTVASLQLRDLCFLHTDAFTQFLLCELHDLISQFIQFLSGLF